MIELLPLSVIIATGNRSGVLRRTLQSVATQDCQPAEMIFIDASDDEATKVVIEQLPEGVLSKIIYEKAVDRGAARQRNQGMRLTTHAVIGFMDDDIVLEPRCFFFLWQALQSDEKVGGVNALVTNQHYTTPGTVSAAFFRLMNGKKLESYAGKVFGPAINLLPADDGAKGDMIPVDWLNSTCTLYRRTALPQPIFDQHFTGYSFMEDLSLSLRVAKNWRLLTARCARIYHDSQPSKDKQDVGLMATMELVNRHYVITKVMGDTTFKTFIKLIIQQLFVLITTGNVFNGSYYKGKWKAYVQIRRAKSGNE